MYEFEEVNLGEKKESSAYYDCFGCRKILKINIDWSAGFNWDSARKLAVEKGWFRRVFYKGADPWACSKECAYNSEAAVYAENYWAKELQENDKSNSLINKIKNWLF